ncbi:hypothetical protein L211DRAFT_856681 [Terfezia boudieri ATCC MYA-4762]|uniref:HNH domain-containing protein n=1 Tax=Terfezia boudieri ATCC MYA-4762 TaxID=1051890 RepID=A0A3N4M5U8_9PEZI|nr:hypothetical protein L211DRAFT_856681 [Terfezia boudieri ATCC MYA-4762]
MSSTETDPVLTSINSAIFKDCLTPIIYRKFTNRSSTNPKQSSDLDIPISELSEFIDYLSDELFPTLPLPLRQLTYTGKDSTPSPETLTSFYHVQTVPHTFSDSLISYGIISDDDDAGKIALAAIEEYVEEAVKPPPIWKETRKEECEICERNVPLTYHHLIPKSTHAKVLKRGWHPEYMLNSVAWICRPCHNMTHRAADNETLAKEFYTIEKLMEREDMQRWAAYQSKRRWNRPRKLD